MAHRPADVLKAADLTDLPDFDNGKLHAFLEVLELIEIRNAAVTPLKAEEIGGTTFTTTYKTGFGPTKDIYETGQRCQHTTQLQCVMYQHDPDVTNHRYDISQIPGTTVGGHDSTVHDCIPKETIEALAAGWERRARGDYEADIARTCAKEIREALNHA